jgi:hypothetical protein
LRDHRTVYEIIVRFKRSSNDLQGRPRGDEHGKLKEYARKEAATTTNSKH